MRRWQRIIMIALLLHAAAHLGTHLHLGCTGWELLTCPAHDSALAWEE